MACHTCMAPSSARADLPRVSPKSLAPCPSCPIPAQASTSPVPCGAPASRYFLEPGSRAVGGEVSASPGQGTLLIDFAEAMGALPTDHALFGTTAAGSFQIGDVASGCAAPVEWPTTPHAGATPGHVNLVSGTGHPTIGPPSREGSAKERRESRFPPLRTPAAVAGRLGIYDRGFLCRAWTFLTGVTTFVVPPSYEPLDESVRPSAVFAIMGLKDQGSYELASLRLVGESWYMAWRRNFDTSPGRNK